MGRSSKYKPEYAEQCYKLCLLGHTDRELGEFFGVSMSTVQEWAKKHDAFGEAMREGKDHVDAKVADALLKRALGGHKLQKQKALSDGTIVTLEEEIDSDVKACETWLSSRRQKKDQNWNPNKKIEHSGEIANPLSFLLDEIDEEAEHESITAN